MNRTILVASISAAAVLVVAALLLVALPSSSHGVLDKGSGYFPDGPGIAQPAEPAEPVSDVPTATELSVSLRVVEKQCFGSAGCNVTVEPELSYNCCGSPDQYGTYSVTLSITGDESGEIISTLSVYGDRYDQTQVMLSTTDTGVVPTVKIINIQ